MRKRPEAAGHADPFAEPSADVSVNRRTESMSRDAEQDIEAILEEVARKRAAEQHSISRDAETSSRKRKSSADANMQPSRTPKKGGRKKKKRKAFSFVDVLKYIFPWRGDSVLEAVRKLVFVAAMSVFSVCLFLIGDYYVGLYNDRKEYDELNAALEETRRNRHFNEQSSSSGTHEGETIDYLEYNEIADALLDRNPDLVGYISIENTKVSYPVVQKKSEDPNENTNDYYLNVNFFQEKSKSGCIFMDFRCNFDEVLNHRRVVENSENLLIYGHNMKNESMFGSLRNYVQNYNYYSEHPIVELKSLYNTYEYKIFSVFIVDGEDYTSKYAFNCWNTLDFKDEDEFYWYVNNAKMRNIISNDVDVTYGDRILTLYTCNSLVANAKLIVMGRMLRPGEDRLEGTQNAHKNDNVLYPTSYYRNHSETFDPAKFVPYGPASE